MGYQNVSFNFQGLSDRYRDTTQNLLFIKQIITWNTDKQDNQIWKYQ